MVKTTQRETIGNLVGATGGVPFDMRRLQAKQIVGDADVESANGASPFVLAQYLRPERRVTPPPRYFPDLARRAQSDSFEYVRMQRLGEVRIE